MKVRCEVESTTLAGDYSDEVEGVLARCLRCEHETEAYGYSDGSVRACLAMMREGCPRGERNFYVGELE
jgi:hypothetical protein